MVAAVVPVNFEPSTAGSKWHPISSLEIEATDGWLGKALTHEVIDAESIAPVKEFNEKGTSKSFGV